MFSGWKLLTNLEMRYNGRIWLTWRVDYFKVTLRSMNAQAITCEVHDITQQRTFLLTVVYSREGGKELWKYLKT